MTALLIIFAAFILASTILQALIFLLLRDALHTLTAQGNLRRQWVKKEREG